MSALDRLVAAALADPLAAARAAPRAIGHTGPGIPLEVIHATGALPVELPADLSRPTPDADRYLERSFPPAARAILQQWIEGAFDGFEAIVLSRAGDSAQRLYYYAAELRRRGLLAGPVPCLFDLALVDRPTSGVHSAAAVTRLATALGTGDLAPGIAAANRRRAAFAALDRRRAEASPVGSHVADIVRAAGVADAAAFDAAVMAADLPSLEGPRLLLVGSAPAGAALHHAAEAGGANIVGERHDAALDRHGPPVTGADAAAIAASLRASPIGPRAATDRIADLRDEARRLRADGIVFWLVEEEEALVWDLPAQVAAARDMGLPHLVLTRRDARDTAADEAAILQFAGSLPR